MNILVFRSREERKMRKAIVELMKDLAERGILPTWENFCGYRDSWLKYRKHLTTEQQKKFEIVWRELSVETMPIN